MLEHCPLYPIALAGVFVAASVILRSVCMPSWSITCLIWLQASRISTVTINILTRCSGNILSDCCILRSQNIPRVQDGINTLAAYNYMPNRAEQPYAIDENSYCNTVIHIHSKTFIQGHTELSATKHTNMHTHSSGLLALSLLRRSSGLLSGAEGALVSLKARYTARASALPAALSASACITCDKQHMVC